MRKMIGIVTSVLALAAIGLTGGVPASGAANSSWTQPDFDAGRSRFNPTETTLNAAKLATLHVSWRLKGDPDFCTPTFGTVGYGMVFVGECESSSVTAYDAATGKLR